MSRDRDGTAAVPKVRLTPARTVRVPTPGRYYALPGRRTGLCYAVGSVWRFAGALGEPDVILAPGVVRILLELEVVPWPG